MPACLVCALPWLACWLAGSGWQNKLTGQGSGSYSIWVGAGNKDCKKGGDVGDISVSCTNSGANSQVTVSNLVETTVGALDTHFYVGCINITKCGPPGFMSNPPNQIECSTTELMMRCGGNINPSTFLGQGTTYNLTCPCSDIRWGFHQSGKWLLQLPTPPANGICTQPEK